VTAPQVLPCLRQGFKKHAANQKLISLNWVHRFPHFASMSRAYRVVVDVTGSTGTVRVETDLVAIGGRRSELSVIVSGRASAAHAIRTTELRLARIVAARLKH